MKILSLFDGMSVAQQALTNIGAKIDKYYASEIDAYAVAVSSTNFPDTIHLGSVVGLKLDEQIDLLIGGSPCQDLSISKRNREGLKGERSGLFYEYVRILNEVKPRYFILENVNSMPKEAKEQISDILGVQPVMINASLVSAQNRKRLFWVGALQEDGTYKQVHIPQPEDAGILLKSILESDVDDKYYIKKPLDKVRVRKHKVDIIKLQATLRENKNLTNKEIAERLNQPLTKVEHWFRTDGSFSIPDEDIWFKVKQLLKIETDEFDRSITEFEIKDNSYDMAERIAGIDYKSPTVTTSGTIRIGSLNSGGQGDRIYSKEGKSVSLSANGGGRGAKTGLYAVQVKNQGKDIVKEIDKAGALRARDWKGFDNYGSNAVINNQQIRKLTPTECLRLQSMPDDYFDTATYNKKPISNTQRYKMCGNAFNCKVIEHILENTFKDITL